ncbi:MAG: hypothetical protein IJ635_12425 [Bacteroidaceae bacterium]|nr:hypothetical protein [Bacteroidaceae bacterium]
MKTNINTPEDALHKVMTRMKEQREIPRLPEDFEDRVMARIEADIIKPKRRRKVVRLWVQRAVSAAAVLAGIFLITRVLMPKEEEQMTAKVETPMPAPVSVEDEEAMPEMLQETPVTTPVRLIKPKPIRAKAMASTPPSTTPDSSDGMTTEEDIEDHAPLTVHDGLLAMQDMSQRMNDLRKQHETTPNTGTPYEDLY